MNSISRPLLALIALLSLTACVDRATADAKLAKGCEAGVNALLADEQIGKVTATEFSPSPEGPDMRHVQLTAILKDDWLETPNTYECVFEEQFGPMKLSHTASIYLVKAGDKTIGRAGGEIMGEAEDFIKLNDAIRGAMYGN